MGQFENVAIRQLANMPIEKEKPLRRAAMRYFENCCYQQAATYIITFCSPKKVQELIP